MLNPFILSYLCVILLGKQQIWRCGVVVFIHLLGIYDILTSPRPLHHIKPTIIGCSGGQVVISIKRIHPIKMIIAHYLKEMQLSKHREGHLWDEIYSDESGRLCSGSR